MDKQLVQPIYPQLRFGVELSRLYPPWYVHPALKNLIYETKINTERRKEFTLNEILSQDPNHSYDEAPHAYNFARREFVSETLYLKDRLVSGKNILGINASPGVHIWLLRHFLGLLPAPLFPKDADKPNLWVSLSKQCKHALIMMRMKHMANNYIEEIISKELVQLPSRNISLIFELFELFRSLGTRLFVKTEIDKRSAIAIVRYFTSSLFTRPYRVDVTTSTDERIFALVLYMIFYWPTIKEKTQNILQKSSEIPEISKYYYLEEIKEENEEDIENIVDELLSDDKFERNIKSSYNTPRNSPRGSPKKSPTTNSPKYFSSDDEPIYLADNFTQTTIPSFEFHTTDNNQTSTPYHTAENLDLSRQQEIKIKKLSNFIDKNITDPKSSITSKKPLLFTRDDSINNIIYEKDYFDNSITKLETGFTEDGFGTNRTLSITNNNASIKSGPKQILDEKNCEIKSSLLNVTYDVDETNGESSKDDTKNITKQDDKIQASTPQKSTKYNKVISSKITRMSKRFQRGSQIIVLHINPCKCRNYRRPKPKKQKQSWDETEWSSKYEEKNNYESAEKCDSPNKVQNTENILDLPNFCCNYTKNIYSDFGNVRPQCGWNPSTCSTENELYDTFIDSTQTYKSFDIFAPSNPFSPKNYTINSSNTLKNRMAKIGWTYGDTSSESTPRSTENHTPRQISEKKSVKKEINLIGSLRKIGSKLNIFKGLTPKFSKPSLSVENLLTFDQSDKMKYEKLPKRANSL